ncbi:uncharacterized protein [Prorops nasuta]|uniref:uncharacterized protein n=1 Tax=Prorops nasuta TaxID=863751 RepID=UPI0034CEF4EB
MERNDRIKFIIQKRSTLKTQSTILTNAVENDKLDHINVRLRFGRLSEHFKNYEDLQDELEILDPNGDHFGDMMELQDRYYNLASKIERVYDITTSSTPDRSGNNSIESSRNEQMKRIKLPVAQLPKFSGEIENWLSFKNTFVTMIDSREDITDLQKFLYLKDTVKGEASSKITIYDASDASYKLAWNLLVETYEKKRVLIAKYLNAIIDTPTQIRNTGVELTQTVDRLKQHVNILASLGINIDEHIVVRLLERSLPLNIHSRWEETLNLDELPSVNQLYKFIEGTTFRLAIIEKEKTRKRAATNIEPNCPIKMRKSTMDTRVMITTTQEQSCLIYKGGKHAIFRFPSYYQLTVVQRWEWVKRLGICRNCLRMHRSPCKSIKCKVCHNFHHTSLHKNRSEKGVRCVNRTDQNESIVTEVENQGTRN